MSKTVKTIIVVCILVAAASFAASRMLPRTGVPSTSTSGEPAANGGEGGVSAVANDQNSFSFDSTASLGEEIPLEIRFRDLANLPADFSDFNEAAENVPGIKGGASFKVLTMSKADHLGAGQPLGADEAYWVATYEFQGDSGNPVGNTVRPAAFQASSPDMSPQLVLVNGNEVAPWSADDSKSYAKAEGMFWPNYASLNSDVRRTLPAVWKVSSAAKPILALAYVGMDGKEHYIKINY